MSVQIVLASGNSGKAKEINQMISSLGFELVLQTSLGVTPIPETGSTFVENAIIKARNAAKQTGLSALADDSGLEVEALSGMPGIYSSRYAGEQASDQDNVQKLLRAIVNSDNRRARFYCSMVLMRHADDPTPVICQAAWPGQLLSEVRGQNGFGYDPIFLPDGQSLTAAELEPSTKNVLSHRGQALKAMVGHLAGIIHEDPVSK